MKKWINKEKRINHTEVLLKNSITDTEQPSEVFCKKGALDISQNLQETPMPEFLF